MESLLEIAKRMTSGGMVTKGLRDYAIYDELFRDLRDRENRIVEIGVYEGESTKVFSEYFRNSQIVALDLHIKDIDFSAHGNVMYMQCDQTNVRELQKVMQGVCAGSVDIIIDDASHIGFLSSITYNAMFPYLKDGGLYIIEDWGTGYWDNWADGSRYQPHVPQVFDGMIPKRFPSHDYGMVGFVKSLVDEVGARDIRPQSTAPESRKSRIKSMTFHSGVCVLVKGSES